MFRRTSPLVVSASDGPVPAPDPARDPTRSLAANGCLTSSSSGARAGRRGSRGGLGGCRVGRVGRRREPPAPALVAHLADAVRVAERQASLRALAQATALRCLGLRGRSVHSPFSEFPRDDMISSHEFSPPRSGSREKKNGNSRVCRVRHFGYHRTRKRRVKISIARITWRKTLG